MHLLKFKSENEYIVCRAEIFGKNHSVILKMIVDTGSSYTLLPRKTLSIIENVNFDRIVEITTGSRVEKVPLIILPTFKALGFAVHHLPVIIHDLPLGSPVDGLLGINFLKKAKAIIDFSKHTIKIP